MIFNSPGIGYRLFGQGVPAMFKVKPAEEALKSLERIDVDDC